MTNAGRAFRSCSTRADRKVTTEIIEDTEKRSWRAQRASENSVFFVISVGKKREE
jgi:hypothetical protein